jgi:hypothetical protein
MLSTQKQDGYRFPVLGSRFEVRGLGEEGEKRCGGDEVPGSVLNLEP